MKKEEILSSKIVVRSIISLLFVAITFISCSRNEIAEPKSTKIFDVDFSDKAGKSPLLKLSDVIDSVTYIPIKFADKYADMFVGEIADIKYSNENYYALDALKSAIYIINKDGIVKSVIDHRGRAANEYITLNNFDVNPKNGEVSIHDEATKRILVYSEDGIFLRDIELEDIVRDFAVLDNGNYLLYTPDYMRGQDRRGLWEIYSDGRFKKQLVEIPEDYRYGGISPNYFARIDDYTIGLVGEEDRDRIYHITKDSVTIKYRIKPNIELSNKIKSSSNVNYWKNKGNLYKKHNYLETEGLMMITVNNFIDNILLFYDKRDDIIYQIKRVEHLIEDVKTFGMPLYCGENRLINIASPKYIECDSLLSRKFPSVTEESDPVIVVSHIK